MYRFLTLILFCFTLVSCGGKKSTDIIPYDDFANILYDFSFARGFYQTHEFNKSDTIVIDTSVFYQAIFDRHNYTREEFDTSLRYYAAYPAKLEKVYARILAEVEKMQKMYSSNEERADTVNFWKDKRKLVIQGNKKYSPLESPIIDSGNYKFSAKYVATENEEPHAFNVQIDALVFNGLKEYKKVASVKRKYNIVDTLDIDLDIRLPYYNIYWIRVGLYEPKKEFLFKSSRIGNVKISDICLKRDSI